jgi:hypothetical protein
MLRNKLLGNWDLGLRIADLKRRLVISFKRLKGITRRRYKSPIRNPQSAIFAPGVRFVIFNTKFQPTFPACPVSLPPSRLYSPAPHILPPNLPTG